MAQGVFGECRFCRSWHGAESEHHCPALDRSRAQSWARIWRYLAGLAEWFEIEAAPQCQVRPLRVAGLIHDPGRAAVWGVRVACRRCGRGFIVCEPAGYSDGGVIEHRDLCFHLPQLAVVPRPRGRRRTVDPPAALKRALELSPESAAAPPPAAQRRRRSL